MSSPFDRIMQDFAKRLESAAGTADTPGGAIGATGEQNVLSRPLTVERLRELQAVADQAFRDFHAGLPRPTGVTSPSLGGPLTMERLKELQADIPWQIEDFRARFGLPSPTSTDEPWRTAVAPAPLPTTTHFTPRSPIEDSWRASPPIGTEPITQAVSQQASSVQIRAVEADATAHASAERTPADDGSPVGEDGQDEGSTTEADNRDTTR